MWAPFVAVVAAALSVVVRRVTHQGGLGRMDMMVMVDRVMMVAAVVCWDEKEQIYLKIFTLVS